MNSVSVIKRWTLGMLWRIDSVLPRCLAIWTKNRCWPWRPVLDVVEVHLADTCNLNCRNCLHFAPSCKPSFADLADLERDFVALKGKFAAVRHVHLLGGEPLLHPDPVAFLELTRRMWPTTRLSLVTNGLLLLKQPETFWKTCRETRTMIDMTWYPVQPEAEVDEIRRKCAVEGVTFRLSTIREFMDKIRLAGKEDAAVSFRACRLSVYCPYLRGGRLYPCATAYHLSDRLPDVPREPGVDIRSSSAREILTYLLSPANACRYCAERPTNVKWEKE